MKKLIRILVSSVVSGATLIGMMQLGVLRSTAQENLCLGLGAVMILGLSIKVLMEKDKIAVN